MLKEQVVRRMYMHVCVVHSLLAVLKERSRRKKRVFQGLLN